MARSDVLHFAGFTLDVRERRLIRGTDVVRLSPKAYEVLVALVSEPGRLMSKDDLLTRVWPDTFVEEGILTVHVAALRKALGDDTRTPGYIATIARSSGPALLRQRLSARRGPVHFCRRHALGDDGAGSCQSG